jgi:transcription elongation GreA/GreB family factor
LAELKSLVSNDERLQNLTAEEEEKLVQQLAEHRRLKTTSVRANNAAAARDMLCTTDTMVKEVRIFPQNVDQC